MATNALHQGWRIRFLLMSTFIFICIAMHSIASNHNMVLASGAFVATYNILSLPFFFLFGASCYSLGALIVPSHGLRSRSDWLILRSLSGYAILSLFGYAIGISKLLIPSVAIATLALPLFFFPADTLSIIPSLRSQEKFKMLLLAMLASYLLCFSGVLSSYIENDFAQYYPAFDISLARGDLLPNVFFWTNIYSKGCGAAYLAMAATSRFSIQIGTLYALCMMGLIVYRLTSMMTRTTMVAIATSLLLLASKVMKSEAYRTHAIFSMMLMSIPYIITRLHFGPASLRPTLRTILALCLCATIIIQPSTSAFMSLPLLYFLFVAFRDGKLARPTTAIAIAAAPTFTFLAMLVFNQRVYGIAELTPLHILKEFINYETVSSWGSPYSVQISIFENLGATKFSLQGDKLFTLLVKALAVSAVGLITYRTLRVQSPFLTKRIQIVLFPTLALGIACPFIDAICNQSSFSRYAIFYTAVQPFYFTAFLLVLVHALSPMFRVRLPRLWPNAKILTTLFSVAAAYALIFSWTPKFNSQLAHTRAFFGITSLAPVLGHWHEPEIDALYKQYNNGTLILPLYPAPYAAFLSSKTFLNPHQNQFLSELPTMLGSDTNAAIDAYVRAGISHFIINLDPLAQMTNQVYAEVFLPDTVQRSFRIRHLGQDKWLLTLHGTATDGHLPTPEFLCRYAKKLESELHRKNNDFYPTVQHLRSSLPEFGPPRTLSATPESYCPKTITIAPPGD